MYNLICKIEKGNKTNDYYESPHFSVNLSKEVEAIEACREALRSIMDMMEDKDCTILSDSYEEFTIDLRTISDTADILYTLTEVSRMS